MVLDGMGMSSEVANNGAATSPSAREAVVSRREHRVVYELCRLDRRRRRPRRIEQGQERQTVRGCVSVCSGM